MKQLGSIPEPNVDLRNISLQCNLAKPTIKKTDQSLSNGERKGIGRQMPEQLM
jgi:hypothetical protein